MRCILPRTQMHDALNVYFTGLPKEIQGVFPTIDNDHALLRSPKSIT